MDRLPLFFDLKGRSVLLIGDGPAADAKRRLIEAAGARLVREAAPDTRLAFVAVEGEEAERLAAALKAKGLLVNVVDRPQLCDFLVPAIVDRSPVVVAIGTGGASASLAKALRERLEALLPASLGRLAQAIFASRETVAATHATVDGRRRFWDRLMTPGAVLDPLQRQDDPAAAIGRALRENVSSEPRLVRVMLTGDDPDELTLGQLRALSQADTVFVASGVPAAILDRARRDAVRVAAEAPPGALPPGLSVFVGKA